MDTNHNAPVEPATITPGPFSEQELREAWNSQADQYNQWDELDSCEQLAIAQTRAIAADRARRAAPTEPPVFALQWSENKPPGEECRYDHCTAQTPFGDFLITWKSWKKYDYPTVDETPWGDSWQAFATVQLAKAACQREFDARLALCGLTQSASAEPADDLIGYQDFTELCARHNFQCDDDASVETLHELVQEAIAADRARRHAPAELAAPVDLDALLSPRGPYETGPDAGNAVGAQLVSDQHGGNPTWWAPVYGCDSLGDLLSQIRSRILPHLRLPVVGIDIPGPDGDWADIVDLCEAEGVPVEAGARLLRRAAWGQATPPADRARRAAPPADGEVGELVDFLERLGSDHDIRGLRAADLLQQQAAELATLRQQQAAPVPVSERLPDTSDPGECRMPDGDCWWFDPHQDGAWYMDTYQSCYTHWLPAHVLPLPW